MKHNNLILKLFGLFSKKEKHGDGLVDNADDNVILAKDFLFDELEIRGMQPEKYSDGIVFHYRGGHFRVKWLNRRIIRFVYPYVYSDSPQAITQLCDIINELNSAYTLVKSVVAGNAEEKTLAVHIVADLYYTSQNNSTPILENLLNQFFEMQHELIILIKENKRRHSFLFTHTASTLFSQN